MYVGRIVAVGRNRQGKLAGMYRVSSRSFPNRQPKVMGRAVAVVPKEGFENDIHKSPYIAYNCLRTTGSCAVVTNGTHTDPITEKLAAGMGMRDALGAVLPVMDFEHDDFDTPRIAGIVDRASGHAALGIVRRDALLVREFELAEGEALYVATYERSDVGREQRDGAFDIATAEQGCDYVLGRGVFADFELPVLAVCALETADGFALATAQNEG
jgi:IMP cyclohydrolase